MLTYVKKVDSLLVVNTDDISNLPSIVNENMMNSHDQFRQVTRDLMCLTVIVYAQSVIFMAITRLELFL